MNLVEGHRVAERSERFVTDPTLELGLEVDARPLAERDWAIYVIRV